MSGTSWLLVALGGALGATLRHLLGLLGDRRDAVPWGTVSANLAGSLLLGALLGLDPSSAARSLLALGLCGALTTYSTFAVQVHDRGLRTGTLTVLLTLPPAIALCAAAEALTRSLG